MADYASETDSEYSTLWRDWFITARGNEYYCDIDEDYLLDRFNLTGLNTEVEHYQSAWELITDSFDEEKCDESVRDQIEYSARHLYGLVHARFIITTRGLGKMPLLPMGMSDQPNIEYVKLYCPCCEDVYNPKSARHASIDGAYFGTSFHNIFFQVYPNMMPVKHTDRHAPRCFGFKVHAHAALQRWQDEQRADMVARLRKMGVDVVYGLSSQQQMLLQQQQKLEHQRHTSSSSQQPPPPHLQPPQQARSNASSTVSSQQSQSNRNSSRQVQQRMK